MKVECLLPRLPDLNKFAFVINLRTVRTLGIDVRPDVLASPTT
jgi:hypothetical protein